MRARLNRVDAHLYDINWKGDFLGKTIEEKTI